MSGSLASSDECLFVLQACNLFKGLSKHVMSPLIDNCSFEEVSKAKDIVIEGNNDRDMFVLVAGFALIHKQEKGGKRIILDVCGAGDAVGYHALTGDTDRIASVTALTDVRCVRVNARVFSEILLQSRRFLRNLAKENTRVINELDQRLMAASHKSNKAQLKALNNRLAKLVVSFDGDYKKLPFKLTHEIIADFCGCSRETVTRLLS